MKDLSGVLTLKGLSNLCQEQSDSWDRLLLTNCMDERVEGETEGEKQVFDASVTPNCI